MEWISSLIILTVLIVVALNEIYQQRMGVSPMATMPKARQAMLSNIPKDIKGNIIELGSGWGGNALLLAKTFPECTIIAVEMSPVPYIVSKFREWISGSKNLKIHRKDLFNMSFKDINAVICYLSNPHMAKLEPKFNAELPKGSHVISSTFYMPHKKPDKIDTLNGVYETKIYIYKY